MLMNSVTIYEGTFTCKPNPMKTRNYYVILNRLHVTFEEYSFGSVTVTNYGEQNSPRRSSEFNLISLSSLQYES